MGRAGRPARAPPPARSRTSTAAPSTAAAAPWTAAARAPPRATPAAAAGRPTSAATPCAPRRPARSRASTAAWPPTAAATPSAAAPPARRGETCGAKSANVCGTGGICTPTTCALAGVELRHAGRRLRQPAQLRHLHRRRDLRRRRDPQDRRLRRHHLRAQDLRAAGFNCGMATDGCGTIISCGTCAGGTSCGGGDVSNVCGSDRLVRQPLQAADGVRGHGDDQHHRQGVRAQRHRPALQHPRLRAQLGPGGLRRRRRLPHCSCGSDVSGSPLVSTVTRGRRHLHPHQHARRRQHPARHPERPLAAPVHHPQRRLLRQHGGGGHPRAMPRSRPTIHGRGQHPADGASSPARSTRSSACCARSASPTPSSATPRGTGRVRFYQGDGGPGAVYSASTPAREPALGDAGRRSTSTTWSTSPARARQYDRDARPQQNVIINYANAGGRVFATHYSYVWLVQRRALLQHRELERRTRRPHFANDPQTGDHQHRPSPRAWRSRSGSRSSTRRAPSGRSSSRRCATTSRRRRAVAAVDQHHRHGTSTNVPMHYTFDTPVGAPPANQCGRVLYDDFHVEDALTDGTTFPAECTAATMTPQEKMLEFMIFDSGLVRRRPRRRRPRRLHPQDLRPSRASQPAARAATAAGQRHPVRHLPLRPDLQRRRLPACGGGCTPKTCAALGIACGSVGDGCGNIQMRRLPPGPGLRRRRQPLPGKCGTPLLHPQDLRAARLQLRQRVGHAAATSSTAAPAPAARPAAAAACPASAAAGACAPKTCARRRQLRAGRRRLRRPAPVRHLPGAQTCGGGGGTANVCGGSGPQTQ